jgi:hypothetical protein
MECPRYSMECPRYSMLPTFTPSIKVGQFHSHQNITCIFCVRATCGCSNRWSPRPIVTAPTLFLSLSNSSLHQRYCPHDRENLNY